MSRNVENVSSDMCAQRRFRSICAFAVLSDSPLCFLEVKDAKFLHADHEDVLDCADAQANLNFRWTHIISLWLIYS